MTVAGVLGLFATTALFATVIASLSCHDEEDVLVIPDELKVEYLYCVDKVLSDARISDFSTPEDADAYWDKSLARCDLILPPAETEYEKCMVAAISYHAQENYDYSRGYWGDDVEEDWRIIELRALAECD